ncbi:MAG: hypothetical protein OXH95_03345, partial [bacterium]|nr:hypothetical protein [bacterium]
MNKRAKITKRLSVIATLVALSLVIGACGGEEEPSDTTPPPAGVTETVTPSDPVDTTQADTPSDETPSDPVATTQAGGPSPADPVAPVTRGPGGEVATPSG